MCGNKPCKPSIDCSKNNIKVVHPSENLIHHFSTEFHVVRQASAHLRGQPLYSTGYILTNKVTSSLENRKLVCLHRIATEHQS